MDSRLKWYEHKLFHWMDERSFPDRGECLKKNCTDEVIGGILEHFPQLTLESVEFYGAGTYEEEGKTRLDNIGDFYLVRMKQRVAKNHVGTCRIYLPVKWNQRFMGIAGAGTNNEVDWFTAVTFNVISWPMALKNGYACAVADNDTGIHLDCTWGFDGNRELEWDHIDAWADNKTLHEMTVCSKEVLRKVYGQKEIASYMHGTSGGGRQVISEAILYPEDYDGLWADGPAINHYDLHFACLWAAVVEANENHVVSLEKYKAAHELAISDPSKKDYPFDSRDIRWMDFISGLLGLMTADGPITRKDLSVMVKTWDGPFTRDGKRMAYGFGPAIQQWPLETNNQLYGYFKRKEDGRLTLMPIAEQMLRWFLQDPDFDVHNCTYEQYEKIYMDSKKKFSRYDFNDNDFGPFAARGGKLMITQGTGDCVVPYQAAIDYYNDALEHFPSERIMNQSIRMYMPYLAGHSILDWSGPAVSCADGMKALTQWVEEGKACDILPTVRYDFGQDKAIAKSEIKVFNQWHYKRKLKNR